MLVCNLFCYTYIYFFYFKFSGHAQALARNQKNEVSFVIHNLPVIAKMAAVAKACGNMFQLLQGHSAETSGGLLICLPREQAAAYCKVSLINYNLTAKVTL